MLTYSSIESCFIIGILTFIIYLIFTYRPKGFNWIRYIKARLLIRSYFQKHKKKFSYERLQQNDATIYDVGILPRPSEYDIENPYIGKFEHCDGIHFSGFDFENNFLDIYFNRVEENVANVWIILKLSNGEKYCLPHSSDTRRLFISKEYGFHSSGLQIKCLVPLRTWRISFNGLLQKFTDDLTENSPAIHVKFSFLWHALSVIQEQNIDFSPKSLAEAFAYSSNQLSFVNLENFYKLQNRYEQWGQLMGTLQIKNRDSMEIYLWSNRTRIFDSSVPFKCYSSTKLLAYFEDGFPLKLDTLSVPNYLPSFTNGYTVNEDGSAVEMKECTFDENILISDSSIAHFSFKNFVLDKNKSRNIRINFDGEKEILYLGPHLEIEVTIKYLKISMDHDTHGIGVSYCVKKSEPSIKSDFPKPMMLLSNTVTMHSDVSVISLEDERCKSSLNAGGKGCSLSLLTSLSKKSSLFQVPSGFVISTSTFDNHIKTSSAINYAIQRVINVSCKKSLGDIKEECEKCAEEFRKSTLSHSLKKEIEEMLFKMYKPNSSTRFSIRSSASDEDSEDCSAAGQMLTVLGVSGVKNIFKAVIECWSSKFGFEAVQYARQNGKPIQSSMAVVVQEMIPSEVSGVLFTVDPVSGDPSLLHITANYGLGETVVSSLAEPDTIVLKREHDSLLLLSRIIGSKKTQVHMKDDDGTVQQTFESEMPTSCLCDDWAIKIGFAGILVEDCYCMPLDIEWAYYKNQLFLLQARPITTLHTETEFELTHDQDSPMRSLKNYWTRTNAGEVFPGATTPFTISSTVRGCDIYGLRIRMLYEKLPEKDYCPYVTQTMSVTHKQIVLNIINMLYRFNDKKVSDLQKAFEISLFGREVGGEEIHKIALKKYGYKSRFMHIMRYIFMFTLIYSVPKSERKFSKRIQNFNLTLENYTTVKKTWDKILTLIQDTSEMSLSHGMSSYLSSFYNLLVITILTKGNKEYDNELYSDFSTLLSECSNVESADVPGSLQDLARIIAKYYGSTFSSLSPKVACSTLENDNGLAGVFFKEFIRKHGHRCIKEFDIYSESWGMNPESLIPILQNMVNSPNILKPQPKKEMSIEAAISKIKTPISFFYKKLLKIILPGSRKAVAQREKTKSMLIKMIDFLRMITRKLGDLMVQEGMLPSPDLVYFLTIEEIDELIRREKPGLVSKAIHRKKLHPKLDSLRLPEIIESVPKPIQDHEQINDFLEQSSFPTIKGTSVCQGKVTATARVIKSYSDVSTLQSGDVLITYSTDIGWSPYFPMLSGVVTEIGGLISHGAVVAREYGLPCIVSAENAMSIFKSGDIVILDAMKGTITKIGDSKT